MAVSDSWKSFQYTKSVFADSLAQGLPRSPGEYPSLMRKRSSGNRNLIFGEGKWFRYSAIDKTIRLESRYLNALM